MLKEYASLSELEAGLCKELFLRECWLYCENNPSLLLGINRSWINTRNSSYIHDVLMKILPP